MKKILSVMIAALMLVSCFAFSGCGKDAKTLTVYTEAGFAPYEFLYNNEIVGVDIEIAKLVAEKLGKELKVEDVNFDTICGAVKSGKADLGIAGITIREDRAEDVDFSIPYSSTEQYLIVAASDTTTKTVEDVKGKKVGIQEGTTSDFLIDELIKDGTLAGSTITPYKAPAAAAATIGTKVDVVVTDKLTAQLIVENNSGLATFPFVKADGSPAAEVEEYGVAIPKGNSELKKVVDEVITELLKSGKMDQLIEEFSNKAKEVEE